MKSTRLFSAATIACSMLGACTSADGVGAEPRFDIAGAQAEIFAQADTWTLYATDPTPLPREQVPDANFHGYAILGEAELSDSEARADLVTRLNAGIRANDDMVAACFNPRHGLRAETDAGSADLLICFECLQIYVYGDGEQHTESVLTSKLPAAAFNRVYENAGLAIAN